MGMVSAFVIIFTVRMGDVPLDIICLDAVDDAIAVVPAQSAPGAYFFTLLQINTAGTFTSLHVRTPY